jgi:hypothetical protein
MTIANARPSRGVEIAWPRPVDFRLSNGVIQYRVRGTTAWIAIFSLSDVGGVNDGIVLSVLQAHGFTVDGNGKLHLTALEQSFGTLQTTITNLVGGLQQAVDGLSQDLQDEITRATLADTSFDLRVDEIESAIDVDPSNPEYGLLGTDPTGAIRPGDRIVGVAAEDPSGNVASVLLADGTVTTPRQRVGIISQGDVVQDVLESDYTIAHADPDGNVVWGILGPEFVANGLTPVQMADLNNRLASNALGRRPITSAQLPVADVNTIVGYGQSLMMAQEAWPALSKVQVGGNTMLGQDVRPVDLDGPNFTPVGGATFQPLVSKVRDANTGAILTDAQVAALSPGDAARGESPVIGMANMLSWLIARRTMGSAQPFNVVVPAVSGMTIEQLSKVNGQDNVNRYNRFVSAVQQSQDAATALGKSHVITAIVFMQGEYDYALNLGTRNGTKVLYKAALAKLHADMVLDVKAITGQSDDPIFIIYQTGASYTVDADANGVSGLHVGMAQFEYAIENPARVIMAGPVYQITDKSGHLDPNGSRWFGEFLAKAYNSAVIEARAFRPVSPTRIQRLTPTRYRVHYHVPEPPLVFDLPYSVNAATAVPNQGFRVTDAGGEVAIRSVDIVAPTVVEIVTGRAVSAATGLLWYAPFTGANGNGCVRDSDRRDAFDSYVYATGTGQYASANIPGLVGRRYPLGNWSVGFCVPVTYQES